jgi:DNA-binding response OmpR family regulator
MARILIAEDDATIAAVLRAALEEEGYAVATAADGEAAWRAAQAGPAAVVLDANLPRLSGAEVLRRLRADARTAATPVLLVSARADLAALAAAHRAEALAKPFDLGALVARVRALAGPP